MERDASEELADNITYKERLQLAATDGRPPPRLFDQLKLTVATYTAK